jgi:predicted RNA-binding Zn-ribbon protein involved in translation (DUF1610 family)
MARCTRCGAQNPDYVLYCGKCGGEITKDKNEAFVPVSSSEPSKRVNQANAAVSSAPQVPQPPMKYCTWCGREVNAAAHVCPFCGKNPWGPWGRDRLDEEMYNQYVETVSPSHTKASGALILGGVLVLLAGVLALGQGILYVVIGEAVSSYAPSGFLCLCGGIDILFGIFSIAAGVFSIQRRHFGLAIIGAVFGMLGLGLLIGFVFGLIGLILIAISGPEFRE